jgi:hypothetical protein
MSNFTEKIPPLRWAANKIAGLASKIIFTSSQEYWERRYAKGKTSGEGSYGKFAQFKADVLNSFVAENRINSVIEFGCGDGNQISLAAYPGYIGLDVSKTVIACCKERFEKDKSKSFLLYEPLCFTDQHLSVKAELSLSLDVIYHLVEDKVFELYMHHLFGAAEKFVIIYSSNTDKPSPFAHVKHRLFSVWVESNQPQWKLLRHIPNKYPSDAVWGGGPCADFFIYKKL